MIPRSERVYFRVGKSPTMLCKSPPRVPPPSSARSESTPGMESPMTSTTRWNSCKRVTIIKDARKPRSLAPATPWRFRIARKTPAPAVEDAQDHPSPLDRKAVGPVHNLKLGTVSEPSVISPTPTSATLVAGGEKQEPGQATVLVGDAYRRTDPQEPGAPKLGQGEDWRNNRWRSLRTTPTSIPQTFEGIQARTDSFRQGQPAFNPLRSSALGLSEAPHYAPAKRAETCRALDMNDETNIYVNGLSKEMNDNMLYLLGSACGVVISHKAMMDKHTNLCKGFGFLMYASSEMAKEAIEWLNSHGFAASFAKESYSTRLRRMADVSSTNVYLSNLPIKFTTQQLEQLFIPHPIASLKILYDIHGESRGVGFVRLYDRAAAKSCIERLHGRVLPGTTLPLQARFADSEAQKHLKHSVSQKHTLESLGLLRHDSQSSIGAAPRACEDRADAGFLANMERHMAMISGGVRGSAAVPPPFSGVMTQMPLIPVSDGRAPYAGEAGGQNRSGLGIQLPSHPMWPPPPHVGSIVHPGIAPSMPIPGVVYSGTEGTYSIDRSYPLTPMVTEVWDGYKQDGKSPAYLPIPFIPLPGLMSTPVIDTTREDRDGPARTSSNHARTRHMRQRTAKPAARVRFPAGSTVEPAPRAVSDPMAMLAVQARVRQALGMPDRVRAAVSADNSIDGGDDDIDARDDTIGDTSMITHTSSSEGDELELEDDSLSVEIQVHA